MTNKAKLGIVALFSCCAMVGMGFASWTISQGPSALTATVEGTVTAESVLSCSAPKIDDLHYSSLGFSNKGGTELSYTTTFNVTYTITSGGYTGEATLTATMGYSTDVAVANNLFTEGEFLSAKVSGTAIYEEETKPDGSAYVVTATVNCTAGTETTVTIAYSLTFSSLEEYTTYFFTPFSTVENLSFTFDATLTGGNS